MGLLAENAIARSLLTCEAILQALPQFNRLTTLDLYGDTWECLPLQAEDLSHLASLTGLQHLGLHHFEISGSLKCFSQGEHPRALSQIGDRSILTDSARL